MTLCHYAMLNFSPLKSMPDELEHDHESNEELLFLTDHMAFVQLWANLEMWVYDRDQDRLVLEQMLMLLTTLPGEQPSLDNYKRSHYKIILIVTMFKINTTVEAVVILAEAWRLLIMWAYQWFWYKLKYRHKYEYFYLFVARVYKTATPICVPTMRINFYCKCTLYIYFI